MSRRRKSVFTGKPSRRANRSRKSIFSKPTSRATRRNISRGIRRSQRDIFKKSPGGQRLSLSEKVFRWFLGK